MAGLSAIEVAERTGTAVERVARMADLGIIIPAADGSFTEHDVQRVLMVQACDEAGLPLEAIGAAVRSGHLSFSFVDLLFADPVRHVPQTYGEEARRAGISEELLLAVFDALGLAPPGLDEPARADDLEIMPIGRFALGLGMGEAEILRVLRVYGDTFSRQAQADTSFYHQHVEAPLMQAGLPERELREMTSQVSLELIPLIERLILWVYRRHREREIVQHTVEHIEAALEEAGFTPPRQERPPAIVFLDLTGYTRLTEERGDEAAADLAVRLGEVVHRSSRRFGGRPVKWLGDGVMFHFPDPGQAVLCSLDMVREGPRAGLPSAHVGVTAGPVVSRAGDYFGRTVNLAARIAGRAGADEVLVSDEAVAVARANGARYEPVGPVELKGMARPVTLHRALPA